MANFPRGARVLASTKRVNKSMARFCFVDKPSAHPMNSTLLFFILLTAFVDRHILTFFNISHHACTRTYHTMHTHCEGFTILAPHTHSHIMAYVPKRSGGYSYRHKPKATPFSNKREPRYNSRRWRAISKLQRQAQPLCEGEGCNQWAAVCDHITPVIDGGNFWAGPFQSLCHSCHNSKTRKEQLNRSNTQGEA